jgi:hypothetical protein
LNPNSATVRLLASEQSNTNRDPKSGIYAIVKVPRGFRFAFCCRLYFYTTNVIQALHNVKGILQKISYSSAQLTKHGLQKAETT